jgi:hypothetical protein
MWCGKMGDAAAYVTHKQDRYPMACFLLTLILSLAVSYHMCVMYMEAELQGPRYRARNELTPSYKLVSNTT